MSSKKIWISINSVHLLFSYFNVVKNEVGEILLKISDSDLILESNNDYEFEQEDIIYAKYLLLLTEIIELFSNLLTVNDTNIENIKIGKDILFKIRDFSRVLDNLLNNDIKNLVDKLNLNNTRITNSINICNILINRINVNVKIKLIEKFKVKLIEFYQFF